MINLTQLIPRALKRRPARFDAFVLICLKAIRRIWVAAGEELPVGPDRPRRLRVVSTRPEGAPGARDLRGKQPARHRPPQLYLVGADLRYRRPAPVATSSTGLHARPRARPKPRAPIHGFR